MVSASLKVAKKFYNSSSSSSSSDEEEEDVGDFEYYGKKESSKNQNKLHTINHNAEDFIGGNSVAKNDEDLTISSNDKPLQSLENFKKDKSKFFDRVFSFQLPFGGNSLNINKKKSSSNTNLPSLSPLNSSSALNLKILSKLLPKQTFNDSNGTEKEIVSNDKNDDLEDSSSEDNLDLAETKSDILLKLEKFNTISSYEEYLLYKNVKGIKSDRLMAFKKFFKPNPKKFVATAALGSNVITENEGTTDDLQEKKKQMYEYEDLPDDFKQHDMNNHEDIDVNEVFSKIKGHVIFIHGYRGATLRVKKTNERIWIPLKETILGETVESNSSIPNLLPLPNPSTRDYLTIPPSKDIFEVDENVVATKILKKVGPIDIMNKLVSRMKHISEQSSDLTVWEFPYDWRLALDVTTNQLENFIQKNINPKEGERNDIFVVAHSMGGLITHKVMTKNPLWFKGIVYVGCPSLVPNMLGPLRHGDSILFNKKILTPEVSFLFRSSFYFLPQKVKIPKNDDEDIKDSNSDVTTTYGRINGTSSYVFVNDKDFNIKYDIDYYNPENWKKYKLSPCLDQELRDKEFKDIPFKYSPEEHYEYLQRLLPIVNNFLNSLQYDPAKKGLYPPMATLYGDTIPTTKGCRVPSLESIHLGEWDNFFYGRGDGVVTEKWLLPEHRGFHKIGKFSSSEGHVSLLTDIKGIARCFDYLLKEWEK